MSGENKGFRQGSLETRMLRFLETRSGTEDIDKLPLTARQLAAKKADYFLRKRSVICEVKSLQTDTKQKIDSILKPLLKRDDAPVFYGELEFEKVTKHFHDGETIRRKVFEALTSAVEDQFEKANRQIRVTKREFSLPAAAGVLVLVNDLVSVLSPELIGHKIQKLFQKRTPQGSFRFIELHAVWLVSETHFIQVAANLRSLPTIALSRDRNSLAVRIIESLQPKWARFNGMPLFQIDPHLIGTFDFKKEKKFSPTSQTRHSLWRRQYVERPYLRPMNESELENYYGLLMTALTPGLFKGAAVEDPDRAISLMERFIHFLEEARHRGIDQKQYAHINHALGTSIRNGTVSRVEISEIENLGNKRNILQRGIFYTNVHGESYRCLQLKEGTATLLFMGLHMGKSLDAVVGVNEPKWAYYWPITDIRKLEALEARFARLAEKNSDIRQLSTR